jgi:competence protein ComEA
VSVTPQERLALGVVALLLATGAAARTLRPAPAPAAWSAAEEVQAASRLRSATGDSVKRAAQRGRPLAPGERLDPATAPADELQRLPRVGPALAARMVAWRATHGPFRTLADLDSVPGVGPALLAGIAPHLTLPPAPPATPVVGRALAQPARGTARAPTATVDLNTATAAELDALPGIGPALAARVVAWRAEHGRFRSVDDLAGVPGIGPALVGRLRGRASATP